MLTISSRGAASQADAADSRIGLLDAPDAPVEGRDAPGAPADAPDAAVGLPDSPDASLEVTRSRLDAMHRLGRAMADASRCRILLALLNTPGHPAQLARDLGMTRTNVSNHLACLRGCGLVVGTVEGRRTRYELADPHLANAIGELLDVVLAVDAGVGCVDPDCDVPLCCGPGAGR